jgi:hypothetical protein
MIPFIKIETTQTTPNVGKDQILPGSDKPISWAFNEQPALLFTGSSSYPDKIKLRLADDASAYPIGSYLIADTSYRVRNNKLQLTRESHLIPINESSVKTLIERIKAFL